MISLKRYLDLPASSEGPDATEERDLLNVAIEEYIATLEAAGNSCEEACPVTVDALNQGLGEMRRGLSISMDPEKLVKVGDRAREQFIEWGHATAKHYQDKANEVKELLLAMARTAESVGARDARCAGQMNEVTDRLQAVASLEDLTQIRSSITKCARELKTSIDRMAAEGKAAVEALREQVSSYRAKLDEAEAIASRDALTGLSSRLYVEKQIQRRIAAGAVFCVALIDIDGFKGVNDRHGHLTGDELLKQFAAELRSACRATDVIGRWGGDEFLLVLDCESTEAQTRTQRLRKWICGSYNLEGKEGEMKLEVKASIGMAERTNGIPMADLIGRADAAMYADKASARHAILSAKRS